MRTTYRSLTIAAAAASFSVLAAMPAGAAQPSDVTFSYDVVGSTVVNTITNSSATGKFCGTSLAPAPGGTFPPIAEVIQNGQTLYSNGDAPQGVTTQTISDVPAGSYVVLASCTSTEGDATTAWISDYPGLDEHVTQLPWTSHKVEQASVVLTVPGPTAFPDLASIISSGSAG